MTKKKVVSIKTSSKYMYKCQHLTVLVDTQLDYLECEDCHEHINPIYFMYQYAKRQRVLELRLHELSKEIAKTENKMRCKCQHCKKMTRIAR